MSFHLTLILIQEKGSENMVKVAIVGCNGKMGGYVADAVDSRDNCETLFGVDAFGTNKRDFPVYKSFDEAKEKPDVIIDFSNPAALDGMLGFALEHGVPCVICTTGYSQEQIEQINKASESIAIFFSGNMSLGINLLIELSKQAARVLGSSFDIEIVEKHHNLKVDAPSGTALMIADGISQTLEEERTRSASIRFAAALSWASTRSSSRVTTRSSPCRIRRSQRKFSPLALSTRRRSSPIKRRACTA